MLARFRHRSAVILVVALLGVSATTVPNQRPGAPQRPAESPSAIDAASTGPAAVALRTRPDIGGERWLEQRYSKARVLPLGAILAAAIGLLLVAGRRRQQDVEDRSSSLPLRRHAVALRAPPLLQLV